MDEETVIVVTELLLIAISIPTFAGVLVAMKEDGWKMSIIMAVIAVLHMVMSFVLASVAK